MATKAKAPRWRAISGFDGAYSVSDAGEIRRNARRVDTQYADGLRPRVLPEKVLRPYMMNGALAVTLQGKTVLVRRAVALAFVRNPAPATHTRVAHNNDDPQDCRAANLQWLPPVVSRAGPGENVVRGEAAHKAVLTEKQVRAIVRTLARKTNPVTQTQLAAQYGVSAATISAIANGRTWAHVTGIGQAA